MIKIKLISICLFLLVSLVSFPQSLSRSVVAVTGISVIAVDGYLSYSLGEAVSGSLLTPVNGITQGFQQPSLFYKPPPKELNGVNVYPNPVQSDLVIIFNIGSQKLLHVDLLSLSGIFCGSYKFNVDESGWISFDMREYQAGFYLLHVYSTDKQVDSSFKIEKM